jgi:hypothetical protein
MAKRREWAEDERGRAACQPASWAQVGLACVLTRAVPPRAGLDVKNLSGGFTAYTMMSNRWPKSAATVLARYQHLEQIPRLAAEWGESVRGSLRRAHNAG